MIELTPIEESVAFQEMAQQLTQKLSQKFMEKGMEKGQLIGQIRLIQRLLKRPQTPTGSLALLDVEELETMLTNLEADLERLEL